MVSQPGRPRTNGPKCGANTSHGPCGNPAGKGTPTPGVGRCHRHGGCTSSHQVAARRSLAVDACERFGIPIESSAEDALLYELSMARGQVVYFRARVGELTADQMTQGTERITRRQRGQVIEDTIVAKSRKNVLVELLEAAQRHHHEVARTCAVLSIEHRRIAQAQEQGEFFYRAMILVLAAYNIPDDDPRLGTIVGEVIEGLTDGP